MCTVSSDPRFLPRKSESTRQQRPPAYLAYHWRRVAAHASRARTASLEQVTSSAPKAAVKARILASHGLLLAPGQVHFHSPTATASRPHPLSPPATNVSVCIRKLGSAFAPLKARCIRVSARAPLPSAHRARATAMCLTATRPLQRSRPAGIAPCTALRMGFIGATLPSWVCRGA